VPDEISLQGAFCSEVRGGNFLVALCSSFVGVRARASIDSSRLACLMSGRNKFCASGTTTGMVGEDTTGNGATESTEGVASGQTPGKPALTQMKTGRPERLEKHTARGSVAEGQSKKTK
jgi:hypothetical protein